MNLRIIALLAFFTHLPMPLIAGAGDCSWSELIGGDPGTELPREYYDLSVETRDGVVHVQIVVPTDKEGWAFDGILVKTAGTGDSFPTAVIPLHTSAESESTQAGVFWLDPSVYSKAIIFVTYTLTKAENGVQCRETIAMYSVKLPPRKTTSK